ncbi:hypothetical protein M406DRAFT_36019 [Cryphonectria parasitica EP155]|uniref:Tyrosinase copper-binding domain-containing protein n=1 Tax=Cryphonectria parasitica (strain ATCC 38755 / EP155) TaxID=660469 RepID=A0A9P5CTY5_CRYP1|nr:uncharacterized protein M406DRAFT_36019 [Cryphonectria parasitica EP155]KAF3769926.1 hypothetical protein M406DRAFT_36019 [Cryphonectria parasitica EP155]
MACSPEKVAVRKDYIELTEAEKLDYTSAVSCLMASPALTPISEAAGVRSRYDDFVATHVNQTDYIHITGNFVYWHRMFIWNFEKALRDECGYTGYLPYWNYAKTSEDLLGSPIFDGTATSQSGNGNYLAHNASAGLPSGLLNIPAGSGGGCIETGPYAGLVANISAVAPVDTYENVTIGPFLSYEPRCIHRDISNLLGQNWTTDAQVADILLNPAYQAGIGEWQTQLQNTGTDTVGYYGLHAYGHMVINGDPSTDFYNSPNEPTFWLHHAAVDRLFAAWQNQAGFVEDRMFQINGTRTMANDPPSDDATIEDLIGLGWVSGEYEEGSAIKNYASIMGGPLCYIYE